MTAENLLQAVRVVDGVSVDNKPVVVAVLDDLHGPRCLKPLLDFKMRAIRFCAVSGSAIVLNIYVKDNMLCCMSGHISMNILKQIEI